MMGTEVSEFIDSAYIWQERALKAEAELALLRKVVDAAKVYKIAFDKAVAYPDKDGLYHYHLKDNMARAEVLLFEALAELDKEGNKKD